MTAKQLANLKPALPGNNLNPAGRKGKTGDKGLSILAKGKKWLYDMDKNDPEFLHRMFLGQYFKACEGDTKCYDKLIELNGEKVDDNNENTNSAPQVIINMPKSDEL